MRKVCPAADFVWSSDDPVKTLGKVTSISFDDPSSLPLKDHPLTTEEVIFCSSYVFHMYITYFLPGYTIFNLFEL